MAEYDIIIIGAGPAGLTAGVYACKAGMKVLLLEKGTVGGQLLRTEVIENFPDFPKGVKAQELAERFKAQALKQGLKIITVEAKQIVFIQPTEAVSWYSVKIEDKDYPTQAVILACGARPKRLGVPREEILTGQGVSYCAMRDAPLFREQEIVVVGAGNLAAKEALYLSKFARKITLIHRQESLCADKALQDRLKGNPKIDFIPNSQVLEILGEGKVAGVKIKETTTGKRSDISCLGVFIFESLKPNTDFVKGFLRLDAQGFIVTDRDFKTSQKGIFACGDCRARALRQVVTACSEGSGAAEAARNYVQQLKGVEG